MMNSHVLIVDDEARLVRLLADSLEDLTNVDTATDANRALQLLSVKPYDVVVTDVRMPGVDGLHLLGEIRRRSPGVDVVVMTAFASEEVASAVKEKGAKDYLTKPFDIDLFASKIGGILEERARRAPPQEMNKQQFVAQSKPIQSVLELVSRVAPTDATVVIEGESGTGKELIARTIHLQSARASKPLVPLHCAALPETILESELFGHEKGAFTGADKRKIGHVEMADGGTLFLDEIGELSLSVQVKLLRVLQERQIFRVGGVEPVGVDTRIVAATNQELKSLVEKGTFRSDLYYRLNVFSIRLPPLRERLDDLEPLVAHLIAKFDKDPSLISPDVIACFRNHDWPGNIRELENVIQRCCILAGGGSITKDMLPEVFCKTKTPQEDETGINLTGILGRISLDDLEKALIDEALIKSNGNKSEAAKLLGITRRRLYSKMESLE